MNWIIRPLPLSGALFEGAVAVYAAAFAQPPYNEPQRSIEVRARLETVHGAREGFKALCALLPGEEVAGMVNGYHSMARQYWHDSVAHALSAAAAEEWLGDAFEIVELAVAPVHQGRGLGTALLGELLHGRQERTALLGTRIDSRAHHLYRRQGFEVITEIPFAQVGPPFFVMGKRLSEA